MAKIKYEDKKIINMSAQFLTNLLPDDFQNWDDEKLYNWVEQNAWQPFENWSGKDLLNQIISCSKVKYSKLLTND